MTSPLAHLCSLGTKLWVDTVDPDLVMKNLSFGATGATSNPLIISDLVKNGRAKEVLNQSLQDGLSDEVVAWKVTDALVSAVERMLLPIFAKTAGDDGYVSFEIDPLIEDPDQSIPHSKRVQTYIELATHWSYAHPNRMIKIPATPAGIEALTPLAAKGIPLNVTLIFSKRQYIAARDAVFAGLKERGVYRSCKNVFSVFVSRLDTYAAAKLHLLSPEALTWLGIVNAKRIWLENYEFWRHVKPPVRQEIVFASTGVKDSRQPAWRYIEALSGSDIQTNPPASNQALEESGRIFDAQLTKMPSDEILAEIDAKVDMLQLENDLLEDGIAKFVSPQKSLLQTIASIRK